MSAIETRKRPGNKFAKLLTRTNVQKVAEHLEITTKEVKDAYKKFELTATSKTDLPKQAEEYKQKIFDMIASDQIIFLSKKHKSLVIKFLKIEGSKAPERDQHLYFMKLKKDIIREINRSMHKDINFRIAAFYLTWPDTQERTVAIRSIGRLFHKPDQR